MMSRHTSNYLVAYHDKSIYSFPFKQNILLLGDLTRRSNLKNTHNRLHEVDQQLSLFHQRSMEFLNGSQCSFHGRVFTVDKLLKVFK